MILDFQSNHLTTVEDLGQGLFRICSRADDALFSAEILLDVKVPALDIRKADLAVKRDVLGIVPDLGPAAEKLIGVRVGPGMTKIVRGLLGGPAGSDRIAEMVLEAMEMLVNALTVPELKKGMESGGLSTRLEMDGPKVFLNDVLIGEQTVGVMADNPRLKNSCAAFSDLD
ncbi:hypothetical protein [Desulfomonile tiedjei]|uniref:Uncharacterized protein n=1 Tax=Desulfomonile tiedjei (strain ATCC 49306 / DSM 6799 / DCB-1) TaxID=706587 RepID=I4C6A9_DESTA|nr:hypothetical protein [Desulfomonile tiedjei]AFM25100.1 hypothetical protein Desti_2418 [Desulfomonile tiedjei DSM 6799]